MARRLAAGASLSAPRADKEHIFTEAHSWGPCMRATEMAAWWQQSSNCQEGTGSLQRGRVQPGSALAAEAEPAPPLPAVTTHSWSLTLYLLGLNQGLLLNFGLDKPVLEQDGGEGVRKKSPWGSYVRNL